jgi:ADP-ribosylglycohydrolase
LAAQIAAALFSHAIEGSGASTDEIIEEVLAKTVGVSPSTQALLQSRESWSAPKEGISLDPIETLLAFTFVADRNVTVLGAYKLACSLRGDTDTVSALAGALVAARNTHACGFDDISWLDQVSWDEISELESIIDLVLKKRLKI